MPALVDQGEEWASWLRSWERSLRARSLSPKTVQLYLAAGRELVSYLDERGGPERPSALTRADVEGLLVTLADRGRTPSGVAMLYRSLQQLMRFLGERGSCRRAPCSTCDRLSSLSRPPEC